MLMRRVCMSGFAVLCVLLSGCFWGQPSAIAPDAFQGPAIHSRDLEGRHLLVVTAPTPGWRATIDHTERQLNTTRIFMTLQRPDPGVLYAQRLVEQDVLTPVPATRDIEVFVRTVDFGRDPTHPPYRRTSISDLSLSGLMPE